MTSFLYHHRSASLTTAAAPSVRINGRIYPATQRNLVTASLLACPDKPRPTTTRPATWWRP